MKKIVLYIGCILLFGTFLPSCKKGVELPPLDETFSKKDKNPFGSFVLHQQLEQMYYHNTLRDIRTNFETTWREINDTAAIYINVSKNLFLTRPELAAMLAFVHSGNTLFISSDRIDKKLLDTLGCSVNKYMYDQFLPDMKYTSVLLAPSIFKDSTPYQYYYIPFYSHFTRFDKEQSVALGHNKFGSNFIVVFYGKGRFYLHAEPRALSNYFLLQKDNYKYFSQLFSLTTAEPEHVYWDDYYNKRNYPPNDGGNKSSFSVLLQYPAMAWAFWLLLLLLALYVLFGGKRRQRIVETIEPNNNTTVAFTETIGRLYLQKKDNRNIADKLITYFLENIRNQYYLNTSQVNEEFIATLSRKANTSKEGVEKLFQRIHSIQQSEVVSDNEVLTLNSQIENFYKNKT
ncbi:MAG: DUF4350 domain-containing protein [Ferruginibacter sp.]